MKGHAIRWLSYGYELSRNVAYELYRIWPNSSGLGSDPLAGFVNMVVLVWVPLETGYFLTS
jgi:hypothetical protein